ncbi:MAG: DUF3010 family protein [Psychrobium sp.]
MYILGIELKGNDAYMALVDKKGRCRHQQQLELGDRDDAAQVATFYRAITSLIKPYSITCARLTRTPHIATNANAIDVVRMETIFQLHFSHCFSMIERDELEDWMTHHLVEHHPMTQFHLAITAAQYELQHNICFID